METVGIPDQSSTQDGSIIAQKTEDAVLDLVGVVEAEEVIAGNDKLLVGMFLGNFTPCEGAIVALLVALDSAHWVGNVAGEGDGSHDRKAKRDKRLHVDGLMGS